MRLLYLLIQVLHEQSKIKMDLPYHFIFSMG